MKKKIVALCLVLALALTAIGGATLAYFTDTDEDVNTMTLGNVKIDQLEKDKEGEDFKDQPLFPMVDKREDNDPVVDKDGYFNTKMENVIDKVITVKNNGTVPAYVRTIILFETNAEYEKDTDNVLRDEATIFNTYIGCLGKGVTYTDDVVEIGGVKYIIAYKVYEKALEAEEVSEPSLKQFFLSPDADNEVTKLFGNEYTILALSQGVQTEGFGTGEGAAAAALNEAFGEITAAKVAEWFA